VPPSVDQPVDELPPFASDVLDLIDQIPPGQVSTYGDLARLAGSGGPRQVGSVLSHYGGAVAWWRVVRADGRPAAGHESRALAHYREEGTPLRPGGAAVDLTVARWAGPR
jgi:alkylated DNA nucleotide flippase Atl1